MYNQLQRRVSQGNLKPGLVEKYMAAAHSRKDRFAMLKEFMLDEDMPRPQKHSAIRYCALFMVQCFSPNFLTTLCFNKERNACRSLFPAVGPPSKDIIHGHMIHSSNCPREAEKRNEDIYEKVPLFQLEEQYSKSQAGRTGSLDLVYT